jgi:hypothetical protein
MKKLDEISKVASFSSREKEQLRRYVDRFSKFDSLDHEDPNREKALNDLMNDIKQEIGPDYL